MGSEVLSPGIIVDTSDVEAAPTDFAKVGDDDFFKIPREGIKLISSCEVGRTFLAEFDSKKIGFDGAPRYAGITVVVRPPSSKFWSKMQSVGETYSLSYQYTDPLDTKKKMMYASKLTTPTGKVPALIIFLWPGASLPPDVASGNKISLEGKFIEQGDQLEKIKLEDAGSVGSDGKFYHPDGRQDLRIAFIHELVHAYYFLIGESNVKGEGGTDTKLDEQRAVGMNQYRDGKYSENRFRAALGFPLRTSYKRVGAPNDTVLEQKPDYFKGK